MGVIGVVANVAGAIVNVAAVAVGRNIFALAKIFILVDPNLLVPSAQSVTVIFANKRAYSTESRIVLVVEAAAAPSLGLSEAARSGLAAVTSVRLLGWCLDKRNGRLLSFLFLALLFLLLLFSLGFLLFLQLSFFKLGQTLFHFAASYFLALTLKSSFLFLALDSIFAGKSHHLFLLLEDSWFGSRVGAHGIMMGDLISAR